MAQFAIPRSTSSRWSRPCGGSWTWGETCITDLSDVDFCGRDDFDPWRRRETFGYCTEEHLYVLTGLVWRKRLVAFPLLDEYHLGRLGDAFMHVVGDVASFLAGLCNTGLRAGNQFGTLFMLYGKRGNEVNHEILRSGLCWRVRLAQASALWIRSDWGNRIVDDGDQFLFDRATPVFASGF